MLGRTQAIAIAAIVGLAAGVSSAQTTGPDVVFSEDFEDIAMPRLHGARLSRARRSAQGADVRA